MNEKYVLHILTLSRLWKVKNFVNVMIYTCIYCAILYIYMQMSVKYSLRAIEIENELFLLTAKVFLEGNIDNIYSA